MASKQNKIKRKFILNQIKLRNFIHVHDKIIGILLAVFVGAFVALAAISFRYLIQIVQSFAFGNAAENIFDFVESLQWWQILLSTTSGGLIISFIYFH